MYLAVAVCTVPMIRTDKCRMDFSVFTKAFPDDLIVLSANPQSLLASSYSTGDGSILSSPDSQTRQQETAGRQQ